MTSERIYQLHGAKVVITDDLVSENVRHAIESGTYEYAEARQIEKIVQRGDRIVELGAGLGYISSIAGKLNIAESIVIFEANPHLIPLIKRNHEINGIETKVINEVVLPKPQSPTVPFYVRNDFWSSSLDPEPWGYREKVDVPTRPFKNVLNEYRPTMLIVDIEGGELSLFDDIPLTGIKKVFVELHQKVIGRVGMKRIFDFFSDRDFHYDQHHSVGSVVLFSHVLR